MFCAVTTLPRVASRSFFISSLLTLNPPPGDAGHHLKPRFVSWPPPFETERPQVLNTGDFISCRPVVFRYLRLDYDLRAELIRHDEVRCLVETSQHWGSNPLGPPGPSFLLFGQTYEFNLAPQKIVIQIIRGGTVQRHSIVFRRQSCLAERVKYCLRAFNGGIRF